MPVRVADHLPAVKTLNEENIFVIPESRASHQDIRPLRIAILNLMPLKIVTETQLLRLIGNTPLQVEITLLHPASHVSKNTPMEHLLTFYQTFDQVNHEKFDGLIITGAPVENLAFEEVHYWEELTRIMDWSKKNVYSTLYICWAAQAGLYHHFGIPKTILPQKLSGVFRHRVREEERKAPLVRGFDDVFYAPHSRHTTVDPKDVERTPGLRILADSKEAGVYLMATADKRMAFVTGHSEYDPLTLKEEYERDLGKGLPAEIPLHYFEDDDPAKPPVVTWRGHANLLFSNWLNYYVYQETPYDLSRIG